MGSCGTTEGRQPEVFSEVAIGARGSWTNPKPATIYFDTLCMCWGYPLLPFHRHTTTRRTASTSASMTSKSQAEQSEAGRQTDHMDIMSTIQGNKRRRRYEEKATPGLAQKSKLPFAHYNVRACREGLRLTRFLLWGLRSKALSSRRPTIRKPL